MPTPAPVTCVIPARLDSGRFPGKLLAPLAGVPVVVHALRRAREAGCFARVVCLTDSPEIAAAARADGCEALLGGPARNGTERIARSLEAFATDLIVDLQGDEPVFPPEALSLLAEGLRARPDWVHVAVHGASPEERANRHRVKVGLDAEGFIVDFFREAPRVPIRAARLQMGAYGYSKEWLRKFAASEPSPRETSESIELLRLADFWPLRAQESPRPCQAIDVPQDMDAALALLGGVAAADSGVPRGVRE
jgi:3-deoxy-manno-octulosonate cytidylyltransferase (CMP-KDO synthetase)